MARGIYTTIRAAVLYETNATEDLIASCRVTKQADRDDEDNKELTAYEAQYAALKRRLDKLNGRPIKTNQPVPVAA